MANQLMGVLVQDLVEVGGDHGAGVHHGVAEGLCLAALADFDPHRVQAKSRIFGGNTVEAAEHLPWVDRQFAVWVDLGFGQDHAHEGQAIGTWSQVEVVANVHGGHQKAQVLGQLLAHALDPREQLAALVAVHQRDQAVADFQADHVDRGHVIPAQLLGFLSTGRGWQQFLLARDLLLGLDLDRILLFPEQVSTASRHGCHAQERHVGHARYNTHDRHDARRHGQGLGRGKHLPADLLAHVFGARSTSHHDRRSCR